MVKLIFSTACVIALCIFHSGSAVYPVREEINCVVNGKIYKENDLIPVDSERPCKKCKCTKDWNADPKLSKSPCLSALCAPIPPGCTWKRGTCCGFECPKDDKEFNCVANGVIYKEHDLVPSDPERPCEKCRCTKYWNADPKLSKSPCLSAVCAPFPPGCTWKRGTCCGFECPKKETDIEEISCKFNDVVYKENEFVPTDYERPCTRCMCTKDWNVDQSLSKSPCLTSKCAPIPQGCKWKRGTCCGFECPEKGSSTGEEFACLHHGKVYKENDNVPVDPEQPCTKCKCTADWNTDYKLSKSPCFAIKCAAIPAGCTRKSGTCCGYDCPEPEPLKQEIACVQDGVVYNENQMVPTNPDRPCTECKCTKDWNPNPEISKSPCLAKQCDAIPKGCYWKHGTCCGFACTNSSQDTGAEETTCIFKNVAYKENDYVPVDPGRPCKKCQCTKEWNANPDLSKSPCISLACDEIPKGCSWKPGTCCGFDCPPAEKQEKEITCTFNGVIYKENDLVPKNPERPCTKCKCTREWNADSKLSKAPCVAVACAPIPHGCTWKRGTCCGFECPENEPVKEEVNCLVGGVVYKENELMTTDPKNPCQQCRCTKDWDPNPAISRAQCVPILCDAPPAGCTIKEGTCCGFDCPDVKPAQDEVACVVGGVTYKEGDLMTTDPENPCKQCRCTKHWENPDPTILKPPCVSIVCDAPPAGCTHKKGTCCGFECPETEPVKDEVNCLFNDVIYKEGDYMTDPEDPCKQCRCSIDWDPNPAISKAPCLSLLCDAPPEGCTHKEGTCCGFDCPETEPVKNEVNCLFNEVIYKEGEFMTDPEDPCKQCKCSIEWDPNPAISKAPCLSLLCDAAAPGCIPKNGTCCEYECPDATEPVKHEFNCFVNEVIYKEGDLMTTDPKDPCKQCKCTKDWDPNPAISKAPCLSLVCDALPAGCTHKEGTCCGFDCPSRQPKNQEFTCTYKNTTYKRGDLIPTDEDRPCSQCPCDVGWDLDPTDPNSPCETIQCDAIPKGCTWKRGTCCGFECPKVEEEKEQTCTFNNVTYYQGDLIPTDADRPCSQCLCTKGWHVDPALSKAPCTAILCSEIPKGCSWKRGTCCGYECPEKEEKEFTCKYAGVTYKEGDIIPTDADRPCSRCVCTVGWHPDPALSKAPCTAIHCDAIPEGCSWKRGTCCGYECPKPENLVKEFTCKHNNVVYKKGEMVPVDADRPCTRCPCEIGWNPDPSLSKVPCASIRCKGIPSGCYWKPGTCCGYECPITSTILPTTQTPPTTLRPTTPPPSNTCKYNDRVYKENEWIPLNSNRPCTRCQCTRSWDPSSPYSSNCVSSTCRPIPEGCKWKSGTCCGYDCESTTTTTETPFICTSNGVDYKEDEWIPLNPERPCTNCRCSRGWDPEDTSKSLCRAVRCAPIPAHCERKTGTCCEYVCPNKGY